MINEVKKNDISYGELPNKFEAGTMATAQVIAFNESINFLNKIGIDNLVNHENDLLNYGEEVLRKNNSVKLIGNPKKKRCGFVIYDRWNTSSRYSDYIR